MNKQALERGRQERDGLFVMPPETDDFDGPNVFQDLIDEPVLNVDPTGVRTGEVADEFFIRGRGLVGILTKHGKQGFGFETQPRRGELLGIFLGLACEDDPPGYHANFSRHRETGVFRPRRIDSRMPGIDTR